MKRRCPWCGRLFDGGRVCGMCYGDVDGAFSMYVRTISRRNLKIYEVYLDNGVLVWRDFKLPSEVVEAGRAMGLNVVEI